MFEGFIEWICCAIRSFNLKDFLIGAFFIGAIFAAYGAAEFFG